MKIIKDDPSIHKIIDKLARYPDVRYVATEGSVTVHPKDEKGFSVSLSAGPKEIIVWADCWHEHFDISEADQAFECFAFMLSDNCRLKIEYRGEKPKRWTIESFENGNWIEDSTTGVFSFNFWSPKRVVYFQNNLLVEM